ncbi:unnamed protein product [Triticum turgidum subsp. durum]|uniref:Uncharacterized protein n=1 Tax=Triticum turgidum subsp. durum TaxID=4567 RepID=A0A9R1RH26_TRITD|nr:unnamed protein product [Triticum turgidum subsp. durum]
MAHSVRAVHHREAADGGPRDRGAAVAGRRRRSKHEPGGPGDAARSRVMGLAAKVHAAVAEGGSSNRDLHRLIDDLMEAAGVGAGRTTI